MLIFYGRGVYLKKRVLEGFLLFSIFIIASSLYFYFFVSGLEHHVKDPTEVLRYSVNSHDHFVYVDYITSIRDGLDVFGLNNNFGIAVIYNSIDSLFFGVTKDWKILAFFINVVLIFFSYVYFYKILNQISRGIKFHYFFFFNTTLIYFAQLINKDSFTIFLILVCTYYSVMNKKNALLIFLPILFLVRIQLGIFGVFIYFMLVFRFSVYYLIFAYCVTSLAGGFIVRYDLVSSKGSLGDGLSYYFYLINKQFIVSNFFITPIRLLQFFQALFSSFLFILPDGSYDVSRIKNIPYVVFIFFLSPYWVRSFYIGIKYRGSLDRRLSFVVFVFCFVWLMNPSISDRYVFLITPVLLLMAINSICISYNRRSALSGA